MWSCECGGNCYAILVVVDHIVRKALKTSYLFDREVVWAIFYGNCL